MYLPTLCRYVAASRVSMNVYLLLTRKGYATVSLGRKRLESLNTYYELHGLRTFLIFKVGRYLGRYLHRYGLVGRY